MRIKSERDFWSGVMFVATGIGFAVGASNYSLGSSARPGPGYFPLMLSVIMAILGAIVLFKSLTIETEGGDPVGAFAWKPLIVIVAAIAVFGLTITRLGMIISIPILITIASYAGEEFHWRDVLINSVVLTVASWLIFIVGLKLTIPVWPSFVG
ncbi:tripartite tricarboxylate transporter TctB family protein [Piscinibacter sp. XHJ-5]|uniref:tripartite tricarboxylate transporter TctB family protein n=1 Tax=Piscinibacter sp. XHJ-5 TaxID=3037797 RepID=UPI00245297DB|nr:tripartite tricarboxylate transporter TctB family protein [Piscinibacter sp. XHJ-5]